MPIFDVRCECGYEEEILVMGKGKSIPFCPECNKRMKKIIGAPNFKVNGFSEANGYGAEDPMRGIEQW